MVSDSIVHCRKPSAAVLGNRTVFSSAFTKSSRRSQTGGCLGRFRIFLHFLLSWTFHPHPSPLPGRARGLKRSPSLSLSSVEGERICKVPIFLSFSLVEALRLSLRPFDRLRTQGTLRTNGGRRAFVYQYVLFPLLSWEFVPYSGRDARAPRIISYHPLPKAAFLPTCKYSPNNKSGRNGVSSPR